MSVPAPSEESDARLRERLRLLSDSAYPELPEEVARGLDRSLAELPELTPPEQATRPDGVPGRLRRWLPVFSAGFAAMLLVAFAFVLLVDEPDSANVADRNGDEAEAESDSFAEEEGGAAEAPQSADEMGEYVVAYSGRDYGRADLAEARAAEQMGSTTEVDPSLRDHAVDDQLRDGCLAQVQLLHQGRVISVDFGYFEGTPAMVAALQLPDGSTLMSVQGARCGPGGADELYSATV